MVCEKSCRPVCLFVLSVTLCAVSPAGLPSGRDVAQKAFPSVVMLMMEDSRGQPISLGSGFLVKENVVATNLHVIEGATRGYAKIIGKKPKYDVAGFVGIDHRRDSVLLKVTDVNAPALSLGDSNQVSVGDEVYAIGNPEGLEGTFSKGIVSGIRKIGDDTLLQITAPISPGSSGGPVLNSEGKAIGISVATFKGGQNLNFAIPVSYLRPLLSNINSVTPLSSERDSEQAGKSLLNNLGWKSTEGVIGTQVRCWSGTYYFSLRNMLREPVTNIVCLVVFYDASDKPIDIDVVKFDGMIPAGLAKRIESRLDADTFSVIREGGWKEGIPQTKVEFRILDFQIVE